MSRKEDGGRQGGRSRQKKRQRGVDAKTGEYEICRRGGNETTQSKPQTKRIEP